MVDAETMLQELNLDETEDNKRIITALLDEADAMIRNSVDRKASKADFEKDPIYTRCLKSLVTQLWYDRTLQDGMPVGIQMMIVHLQSEVSEDGFHNSENLSTLSNES